MTRTLTYAGLMGAAVGVPYAVSNAPNDWQEAWAISPAVTQTAPVQQGAAVDPLATAPPNGEAPEGPNAAIFASPARFEGPTGIPAEQVLRWNIDRNWVYSQWARKSTGLAEPKLFGVRVPLVTGYGMTDAAGSLSYYFDRSGYLQKIRFYGHTADTTRLIQLLGARFGVRQVRPLSPGDQLFQAIEGNRVRSQLRTTPESVLWGSAPHSSFLVRMELNRPGSEFFVEPDDPTLLIPGEEPPKDNRGVPDELKTESAQTSEAVFPGESVVPEGEPNAAEAAAPASESPPPPADTPKTDLRPLDGYRDMFRWPT